MLELLAYVVLLLVVMPALLLWVGKLIAAYDAKLSLPGGVAARAARFESIDFGTLHERLTAAAAANPILPRFSRSKKVGGRF